MKTTRLILILRICLIWVAVCIPVWFVRGQEVIFSHLKTEHGLSQNSILSIYQDEFGQMWLATRDGLNRYDGNRMEYFRYTPGSDDPGIDNYIQHVTGDRRGNIYFQCNMGVVNYNLATGRMSVVARGPVISISYGKSGLWIAKQNEAWLYTPDGELSGPIMSLADPIEIRTLLETSTGDLCVGTRKGLYMADKNRKLSLSIPDILVYSLFEDRQGNIWAGSTQHGLYMIDRNGEVDNFRHDPRNPNSLANNYVRAVSQDDLGNYWIGTFNGITRFDATQQRFYRYFHADDNPFSLSNNSVLSTYKDMQGNIWIGTFFGGANIINPQYTINRFYRRLDASGHLNGGMVSDITQDDRGLFWICTEDAGLNAFDPRTEKFQSYFATPGMPLNIKSVLYDKARNCLWLGSHIGGLNLFDLSTKKVRRVKIGDSSRENDYVRAIILREGKLYLGTHNAVMVFDPVTGQSAPLVDDKKYPGLHNRQIWDMMLDSGDHLWFSSSTGVYKYHFRGDSLSVYTHDPDNPRSVNACYLNTFFEASDGVIYIGSAGSGINIYHPESDDFSSVNTSNSSIIDDYILSICQSPVGYILIATNRGLSRYDADSGRFSNYLTNDFFHFAAINERSLHTTDDGKILVGCIGGLAVLTDRDLNLEPTLYTVNLTRLTVNNNPVKPGDKNGILKESMLYTRSIELNHRHSVFSVEYAVSNYLKSFTPRMEYMLEGFDSRWIESDRNTITYTNLRPGAYRLRIRVVDDGSSIIPPEVALDINVMPPFYKTIWAYAIYAVLILLIAYFISRNYAAHIRLRSSLDFASKEKKRIEELNQTKLRFFTNVSHEFRTPLTLIKTQLEQIIEDVSLPHSIYGKVLSILRNTEKIGRLTTELLEFRKQEQGFMKLKVRYIDVVSLLNEAFLTFREYAKSRRIVLSFKTDQPCVMLWGDPVQLEKAFYNILSNAFKFAGENDSIVIRVSLQQHDVLISVADTGVGIPEGEMDNIFNRFYQVDQASGCTREGTGIGLALSKNIVEAHFGRIWAESNQPKGAVFHISLPLEDHFEEGQKVADDPECVENIITGIPETNAEPSGDKTGRTILIVDDNEELLQVMSQMFSPFFTVYTATDGQQGYTKTIELQPALVLADVMMPKMSGTEMCRRIKNNIETSHIPVVLLTARVAPEQTLEGLLFGADDYVTKPFNARILIARCNNIVNGRKALQERFVRIRNDEDIVLTTNPHDQRLLQQAVSIVEANLTNDCFDINEFAERMHLGRTTLFSKIKGVTGMTPNDFIMNIRLKTAVRYLCEDKRLSIGEISVMVGFSDPPYFIRCFKKMYGITPAQYRRKFD